MVLQYMQAISQAVCARLARKDGARINNARIRRRTSELRRCGLNHPTSRQGLGLEKGWGYVEAKLSRRRSHGREGA